MRRMLGMIGATAGGWIGWYLGAGISLFAAFMVGMIGTGVGMYLGYRFASSLF